MPKKEKPQFFEIVLNVLGYRERTEWVALALEMDLRGYGQTWDDALSDLKDLVLMQMGFAHFKKQRQMIFKPADPIWFQLYADARRAKLESETGREETVYHTGGLSISPPHVIAQVESGFKPSA